MATANNTPRPASTGAQSQSPVRNDGTRDKLNTDNLAADASAVKDEAQRIAGSVADEARNVAGSVAAEARGQLDSVVGEVKDRVADATEQAKDMAATQKDKLAEQIGGIASAAERVASDLEGESAPGASYVRMVADNAQRLSGTIRDSNVDELLGMAEDFGRRQPAAFLGAAALLGFTASRFLTASAKRRRDQGRQDALQADQSQTTPSMPSSTGINGTRAEGRL